MKVSIKQTYLSILYLVGDFFYSLFNFCFIIVFLAAGFGLTICWLGIPLVIFLFEMVKIITSKERNFTEYLLPVEFNKISFNSYPGENLLRKFKLYVTDKHMWKYIGFHLLKFPVVVVSFSLCMFLVLLPVALITAPLIYNFVPYNLLFWEISSLIPALLLSISGIGLAFIFFPILNKIALKQGLLMKNLEG